MPDLPWFNIEEGIQRSMMTGMLERICPLRSTHPHWEGSEDVPFTTTVPYKCVIRALTFLKSSVIPILRRPVVNSKNFHLQWKLQSLNWKILMQ